MYASGLFLVGLAVGFDGANEFPWEEEVVVVSVCWWGRTGLKTLL